MKGISQIIEAILILIISILLIYLAYQWSFSSTSATQKNIEKNLQTTGCLNIENIDVTNKKITIRNCGENDLSNFVVYLDSEPIANYSGKLSSGNITTIVYTKNIPFGDHDIKVSSDYAETPQITFNVAPPCDILIYQRIIPFTITKNNKFYCLAEDVNIGSQNAINFSSNVQGSTLDCWGHNINGNDVSNTSGVYLTGSNTKNNVVKNCNITNFDTGIYLNTDSNNNILTNDMVINNSLYGIYLYSSSNNNLINNTAYNNHNTGIKIESASNNNVTNNTVNSNGAGIVFVSSSNNNLISNVANNDDIGILLSSGSSNNNLISNTANNNSVEGIYLYTGSNNNNVTNNTVNSNGYGLIDLLSSNNIVIGGSIISSSNYDYGLDGAGTTNNFTNTNFTSLRKVHFADSTSWFNYQNDSTSGILLGTSVSTVSNVSRKLVNWNNTFIKWNDTSDNTITATYNLTGLIPNTNYRILNNSFFVQKINSGPNGQINFTINLPAGQEHEIIVSYSCDYYIFSSDIPYTITQNSSLYCLAENVYMSIFNNLGDASCYANNPNTNYGSDVSLQIGSVSGIKRAVIKFNLSSVPSGTKIINATLMLDFGMELGTGSYVNVSNSSQNWEESTVTWNNMPSPDVFQDRQNPGVPPNQNLGFYGWNVTNAVITAFAAGKNVSFIIKASNEGGSYDYGISSKEMPYADQRPYLIITYASNQSAIKFASGIYNSTLNCLGLNISNINFNSFNGISLNSTNTNNTIKNCFINNFNKGIYLGGSNNQLTNNIANSNSIGILIDSGSNNTITGGSVYNSNYDYYLSNAGMTNNFNSTNLIKSQIIYFNDSTSWFNYQNDSTSGILLGMNVSAQANVSRKLVNWNNTLIQWNDTFFNATGSIIATYNLSSPLINTIYRIYNNSISAYIINSSSSGQINFTINLPAGQEHEIKAKPSILPPLWFSNSTNNTIAGKPTLFSLFWTDDVELSGYNFSTNNTGTWVNDSWKPFGITRVQGKRNTSNNSVNIGFTDNITLDSNPTNGNVLILTHSGFSKGGDPVISNILQSGVTWNAACRYNSMTDQEIWIGIISSNAQPNLTINFTNMSNVYISVDNVYEYSDIITSNYLDKNASQGDTSGTTLTTGTTGTTTQANELWIGLIGGDTAGSSEVLSSPTNGFNLLDGQGATYDTTRTGTSAILEKIVSTIGQASSSVTANPAAQYSDGCIATFRVIVTTAWSNITKTLNTTAGTLVQWCVYANDTDNNWNSISCLNPFSLITT